MAAQRVEGLRLTNLLKTARSYFGVTLRLCSGCLPFFFRMSGKFDLNIVLLKLITHCGWKGFRRLTFCFQANCCYNCSLARVVGWWLTKIIAGAYSWLSIFAQLRTRWSLSPSFGCTRVEQRLGINGTRTATGKFDFCSFDSFRKHLNFPMVQAFPLLGIDNPPISIFVLDFRGTRKQNCVFAQVSCWYVWGSLQ